MAKRPGLNVREQRVYDALLDLRSRPGASDLWANLEDLTALLQLPALAALSPAGTGTKVAARLAARYIRTRVSRMERGSEDRAIAKMMLCIGKEPWASPNLTVGERRERFVADPLTAAREVTTLRQHAELRVLERLARELVADATGPAAAQAQLRPRRGGALPKTRPTLTGVWLSEYWYPTSGSQTSQCGRHWVVLRQIGNRLSGVSRPHILGSVLEVELWIDRDIIVTGTWIERTSKKTTYHGAIQLILDPIQQKMHGKWVGFNRRFEIATGDWRFTLVEERTTAAILKGYDYRDDLVTDPIQ